MIKPKITVMTDPIPVGAHRVFELIKKNLRPLKKFLDKSPTYMISSYRGHPAVTRSLVEGLQKINISVNYNPQKVDSLSDTVIVLGGVPALKQAINFKKKGVIKKLLAGPNLVVFPSQQKEILSSTHLDICIVNCDWTKKLYETDLPALKRKISIWPAGVDVHFWYPKAQVRDTILIYIKKRPSDIEFPPVNSYLSLIEEITDMRVEVLQYGQYKISEYKNSLQRAALMVGFSTNESQGLAWAEAWSMDVPTFIWKVDKYYMQGVGHIDCSASPYLTNQTGVFFDDLDDFSTKILNFF
jgi:hypothetical protein